jgi:hypothetical protein
MDVRERFRAWVHEVGTHAEVATRLGCSQSMVSGLGLDGPHGRLPGLKIAHAIERETAAWPGGPIRTEEWDAHAASAEPTADLTTKPDAA